MPDQTDEKLAREWPKHCQYTGPSDHVRICLKSHPVCDAHHKAQVAAIGAELQRVREETALKVAADLAEDDQVIRDRRDAEWVRGIREERSRAPRGYAREACDEILRRMGVKNAD